MQADLHHGKYKRFDPQLVREFKGVPAKVVAQIMGHTKVDTTMTQVLNGAARLAADRVGSELFRVVQIPDGTTTPTHRKDWLLRLDSNQQPSG